MWVYDSLLVRAFTKCNSYIQFEYKFLTSLYINRATPQTISMTHRYFISGYLFLARSTPRIMTNLKQNKVLIRNVITGKLLINTKVNKNKTRDWGIVGLKMLETLAWFLRNKSGQTIFSNISLNVPYEALLQKNTIQRRGHHTCLSNMMGQSYLCLMTQVIKKQYFNSLDRQEV